MRKLSLFFQETTKIFLLFVLAFVWLRYFIRSLVLTIVLSILLTAIMFIAAKIFLIKKKHKTFLKLKEKEEAENMFLSLAYEDKPMLFFEKMAGLRHQNISVFKNYLSIFHKEESVKTILFFEPNLDTLTSSRAFEIIKSLKKEKATKIVICCFKKESFTNIFKEKVIIFDQYETYQKLFKYYDFFPNITREYPKEKRLVFKEILANSFNKSRTKGYLFSAFILIVSSIFVRASLYYCIISSLLLLFALISQYNPYFNKSESGEVL